MKDNIVNTEIQDKLLIKYRMEIEDERNDGWWKSHYRKLYEQRLANLNQARDWNPSDGPESADEM